MEEEEIKDGKTILNLKLAEEEFPDAVNEKELTHIAKDDWAKVRADYANLDEFLMIGNVNHCNLTDLCVGSSEENKIPIQKNDIPGYGEIYGHCVGGPEDFSNQKKWIKGNKF